MDEVKQAVFELGGEKGPGPDGFPIQFFKQFWQSTKLDLFRLCEDFYSGILANRLSKVLNDLVDLEQSAFVKGRCILDNIATEEGLIFSMRKHRLSGHILKVDFAKSFLIR
ncbi:uncharacterized protein LOC120255219 [Dioscorea cayenensis subsp. rotundata]|uniref:Uncharacterized protein LOC120255219 n=1 Tax=Dioscorea cayennensis subsp. rotundata TaxID=55577 RepID=A0AB40AVK7_DIOCR|nr:uncharacterized protein LOC120255219 [Dioscorea cayenensis subsp. rotundata]